MRWEMVCDENGIGGDGEYCGSNDAQLGRISAFCHEVSNGKYMPGVVLFDLEPGVIGAATLCLRSASSPARENS